MAISQSISRMVGNATGGRGRGNGNGGGGDKNYRRAMRGLNRKSKNRFSFERRNTGQESNSAIDALRTTTPALMDLASRYDADLARQDVRTATARAEAENEALRTHGLASREAELDASPELRAASDGLLSQMRGMGPSDLEAKLRSQANEELDLGGQLTPEEARQAEQAARAAAGSRGMNGSPAGSALEVLSRVGAVNQRKDQRRGFALGLLNQEQQRLSGERSFTLGAASTAQSVFDPRRRLFGPGGSSVGAGATGTRGGFSEMLNLASNVGGANQSTAAQMTLARAQDVYNRDNQALQWQTFNINRQDTLAMNAANNSAAAGAASSARTSGYVQAGTTALMALALL